MAKQIPVYLFVGQLESGKTKFIQETMEDPNFDSGDKTLLLVCEEGELEYDPSRFAFGGVHVAQIEDKSELTPENLTALEKKSGCGRVIIEYNGMWLVQELYDAMPDNWLVYQCLATADGTTIKTYEFLKDDTVHNYVATFYAQFDAQFTAEMYAALKKQDMTLPELVTLASFVQEEAGNSQDSNVAQVFRNRLAEGSPYPMLQSNTSSYVQSDADNNYLWNWVAPYYGGWDDIPENILAAYDTYSCTGLPAGPISNPGLAAIKAALEPQPDEEAKDAYFFVTDLKGNYYYAHTLAEHNANCKTAAAVNKSLKN